MVDILLLNLCPSSKPVRLSWSLQGKTVTPFSLCGQSTELGINTPPWLIEAGEHLDVHPVNQLVPLSSHPMLNELPASFKLINDEPLGARC